MKTINKIQVNGEEYQIAGQQVQFVYVPKERIEAFLKINPERVEVFRDDIGKLYIVDKGDLDLYWLRNQNPQLVDKIVKKRTEEEENEFLKGISFDLF